MRFDQVKLVSAEPEALAAFYQRALGLDVVLPLTTLEGPASVGVGAAGHQVAITILELPGDHDEGPTLEIYTFVDGWPDDWPYQPGQGHLAFQVDDHRVAVEDFLAKGGSLLGKPVDFTAPSGSKARFVFLRDPEGNLVDLWSRVD